MRKLFKNALAVTMVFAMVVAISVTAFAQTEMSNMSFVGYDTTNPYAPNKIFNEVVNGNYTNKQVLVPITPEWKNDGGFEGVYPYAGYDSMYLEGEKQEIARYNSLFPQWETKRQDYMWEIVSPHYIWERQRTNVPGQGWTWDFGNEKFNIPDSVLQTKTVREAVVVDEFLTEYGFGPYSTITNDFLTEEEVAMYEYFGIYDEVIGKWAELTSDYGLLSVDSLSAKDPYTKLYEVTDEEIAEAIGVVYSNNITAKFNYYNNDGLTTKNIADEYLANADKNWAWDADSLEVIYNPEIEWTAPAYEMAEPYMQYQYLIVNGIVFDGKDGKEEILRYTGGNETPVVEWRFAFFQYALDENGEEIHNVYETVQQKFVDGVAAFDENGDPVYRVPVSEFVVGYDPTTGLPIYQMPRDEQGEYSSTYYVFENPFIEYWVVDAMGNKTLIAKIENWNGTLDGAIDAYISGSLNLDTYVAEDRVEGRP